MQEKRNRMQSIWNSIVCSIELAMRTKIKTRAIEKQSMYVEMDCSPFSTQHAINAR